MKEEIALSPSENKEIMEVLCDRRRRLIMNGSPTLGSDAFIATKMAAAAGSRNRTGQKITAVAVGEHGNEKFCKVHRFFVYGS